MTDTRYYTTTEVAQLLGVQPGVVRQKAQLRRNHGQAVGHQQPYSGDWLWTDEDIEKLRLPLPRGRPTIAKKEETVQEIMKRKDREIAHLIEQMGNPWRNSPDSGREKH